MTRARAAVWLLLAGAWIASEGAARADGALETVATAAARTILRAPAAAAVVVSAPLASDVAAPRAEELAARLAQLVAGSLPGVARAHAQTAALPQARAIAARGGALVFAQPAIDKGWLRLTLDVYPTVANVWDRARDPSPPPREHSFSQAPLDAEARAYLVTIPLERASVHRAAHQERDVLSVACGDLDGDGGLELSLVSRARVTVGKIVGARFVSDRSVDWAALAPRASVPLREPLGGASIVWEADRGRLLAGTTDRGGVALDAALEHAVGLRGVPIPFVQDACVVPRPAAGAFEGIPTACGLSDSSQATRFASPSARYDAIAGLDVVRRDGSVRAAAAAREPGGKLSFRFGEELRELEGAGAQLALADLDQDGFPEIVTTESAGDDAVVVRSWDPAGGLKERLRLPAGAGVAALGACPPEREGRPAVVAVVGAEVWIVR